MHEHCIEVGKGCIYKERWRVVIRKIRENLTGSAMW